MNARDEWANVVHGQRQRQPQGGPYGAPSQYATLGALRDARKSGGEQQPTDQADGSSKDKKAARDNAQQRAQLQEASLVCLGCLVCLVCLSGWIVLSHDESIVAKKKSKKKEKFFI